MLTETGMNGCFYSFLFRLVSFIGRFDGRPFHLYRSKRTPTKMKFHLLLIRDKL